MKVLAIGDVVGSIGCKFLRTQLPTLKKEKNIACKYTKWNKNRIFARNKF